MPITEIHLVVPPGRDMVDLLGQGDHLLKLVEDQFEADIGVRGNEITVRGDDGIRMWLARRSPAKAIDPGFGRGRVIATPLSAGPRRG